MKQPMVNTYEQLKGWRMSSIEQVKYDHTKLNEFHDELITKTVKAAIENVTSEWGPPPAHFAFFMMGSAARFEQALWSDQDHGLVYLSTNDREKDYFLKLGKEISTALACVGYVRCDGLVMASSERWCKSLLSWNAQIQDWIEEESFETLRHLLTFFDSRVFIGNPSLLDELKDVIFLNLKENPSLMQRFYENVERRKKAIGVFGQLLVESYGSHHNVIHLKNTVLFPYVNSLRLLALQEQIKAPETLVRFEQLPDQLIEVKKLRETFARLLQFRLRFQGNEQSYETIHLLKVDKLTSNEKQELKEYIRSGARLYKLTKKHIDKGCGMK
ncbi:DUF294 nucleotidyltransferase-like domain-containing protein [Alkalihalobacterium chitinilyticum]|uniref:DUF294 nucleotidyltransferase-like domain-containing protein n=1 Tax=Alkalihalobacterium chitinilyticum TaxID=2980103 RepID=A0ABT5VGQ5_9BACI|nr:DUF294 nucleotidyltransferase-like domain-containing protein [Alkalihalobacterium chitinilyticum]MDE5414633.1 DUF294 nucleotidyltransferase-like domain-containing protein [Alkalihalobacterium chitinilyticum]